MAVRNPDGSVYVRKYSLTTSYNGPSLPHCAAFGKMLCNMKVSWSLHKDKFNKIMPTSSKIIMETDGETDVECVM